MAAISQTTLSITFSWMKMLEFWLIFSLKFVPKGSINNIPALVQIMAWYRWGDKPLSEPMMVRLPTHICVTRPQWVNILWITAVLSENIQNDWYVLGARNFARFESKMNFRGTSYIALAPKGVFSTLFVWPKRRKKCLPNAYDIASICTFQRSESYPIWYEYNTNWAEWQ